MSQNGGTSQKPGTSARQVQHQGQQQGQQPKPQQSTQDATQTQPSRQPSSLIQNLALGASAITNCLSHDRSWPELGDILTRKFESLLHSLAH